MKRFFLLLGYVSLLLLVTAGCTRYSKQIPTGSPIAIDNVYSNPYYDHSLITNVLLLPIDNFLEDEDFAFQRSHIRMAVLRSFGKFSYFNLHYDPRYPATAGRVLDLDSGEIDRIKIGEVGQLYRAQAVMQISIEDYRPFPPLRMKIKANLIDTDTGERIWSFDHMFDTDDANVVNGMRYWWNARMAGGDVRNYFEVSRIRPSLFAGYVFYTMAQTYGAARVRNMEVIEAEKKNLLKSK